MKDLLVFVAHVSLCCYAGAFASSSPLTLRRVIVGDN
jgi:hypothetical protein